MDIKKAMTNSHSLLQLAERAYQDLGVGHPLHALLKALILADPYKVEEAVDIAVRTLIRAARLSQRAGIKSNGGGEKFLFSDWPLMDGHTKLAKATKEQLEDNADHYHALAKGNARGEWFLRSIITQLAENQPVHEVFVETDLVDLWQQSGQAMAQGEYRSLFHA